MSVRGSIFTSAIAISAALIAAPAAAQTEQRRTYQLEAQDLDSALRSVGRTSNSEIIFETEIVAGRRAPALNGQYTPREAVEVLIRGSNLVVLNRRGAIIIRERFPASPTTVSDGAGDSEIVVTGSRIRGGPASSPMTSISRRDAELAGHTDLGQMIRDLPQNFSGGQNPTIAPTGQGNFSNVSGSSTLNLRGLGPDASLTLLNGHRVAFDAISQGIDISAIPLAAIERVDVMTDGASALYGSDAVAGVANIVLRRSFDRLFASARIGAATEGGAFSQQYSAVGGPSWTGGSVLIAGDFSRTGEIEARQRSYTNNLLPDSTVVPGQKQLSIVLAGRQAISDRGVFEIDGHFTHRTTARCISPTSAAVSISCYRQGSVVASGVDSWSVSPSFRFSLLSGWNLNILGTYSESDNTISNVTFAGGVETMRALPNYDNSLRSVEVGAEGPIFSLPGGESRLAIGAGYRSNRLRVDSRRFVGGVEAPIDVFRESRKVLFGYGEVSLPLISETNAVAFARKLQVNGAIRFEDHKGIDRVTTPKLGLIYSPINGFELKASWGKSFKVPTLFQTGQTTNAQLVPGFIFNPSPTNANPVLLVFGGNRNLQPERATTLALSTSIEPAGLPGLRIDLGYFRIQYKNRVAEPISPVTSALLPVFGDFVALNPSAADVLSIVDDLTGTFANFTGAPFDPGAVAAIVNDQLQNISLQSAEGFDGSVSFRHDLENGKTFSVKGALSYLDSTRRITTGLPSMPQSGLIFQPPHWRGRMSASWEEANFVLSASGSFVGGSTDNRFQPTARVRSFVTFDTVATFRSEVASGVLSGTNLTIAIQNLFNERPSLIRTIDPAAFRYDSINQSPFGRVISLTLSKAW